MKKYSLLLASLLALASLAGCGAPAEDSFDGPVVCASFSTMADFAAKIGGQRIRVHNLVPAGAEPHDWEPTTRDMSLLETADLLVVNGAGFEHWVDTVVPALQNPLPLAETAAGIPPLEVDHDDGHSHSHSQDPHVWLNPLNAIQQLAVIRDALTALDPGGAAIYAANYAEYEARLLGLDETYSHALAPLPGRDIVVAHEAFGHLCNRYGLHQVAAQGLSPEGEPDPAQMAQVIQYARTHKVRVIFFEELASPKVAQVIAREIGATTAVLNPLESLTDQQLESGEDYFSIMEQNLAELVVALE